MKTIYFDCGMGAAGDMISAALLELQPDREKALQELNQLGIPGVKFLAEDSEKCGVTGTHLSVLVHGEEEGAGRPSAYLQEGGQRSEEAPECHGHDHEHHEHDHHDHDHDHHEHDHDHHEHHEHDQHEHDHDHHEHEHDHDHHEHDHEHGHDHHEHHEHGHTHHHQHMNLRDVQSIVENLQISESTRQAVMDVYRVIAAAESQAHHCTVEEVHFHEVGAIDAIADITAACYLMEKLNPGQVVASSIRAGKGTVECAHGILPVPAPATAIIMEGMPYYAGEMDGEFCTPTGAALLKHFVTSWVDSDESLPIQTKMRVTGTGRGMGRKNFPKANCLTVWLGEAREAGK